MNRVTRVGLSVAAVGLAVIIIALAVVASGRRTAPPPEAASAPKAETATFIRHPVPLDAPTTVFKDAEGVDRTLQDYAGKVVIVNFWATWCAPCIREMPTLDRLQAQRGGDALQVLAISQDRGGARIAKPFIEKNGWSHLGLFLDSSAAFAKDASLRGLPTTLIIDKNGKEVVRVEGEADWSGPDVEKILTTLLSSS